MQPLPIPCPAGLIPDATDPDTFNAAYRAAQEQQAVFIAVEHHGPRWTVKADTLTAPQHTLDPAMHDTVHEAVTRLIRAREIRSDSFAGPVYYVLHDIDSEPRARELAAALHAAFYGSPGPLAHTTPHAP
ncbi:hypothetical protein OG462_43055 [Streptomyces sp. NBC_01077]|uniref:hypothetical protein n=1 Tax=Streptomyces sp. NBC_01077 TaxID=2903746 RepID=UPI003866D257|nr:hypothetical protein OG462_01950 [Streptomyces sp. NBC_01077]WSV43580.1 hypothetical protein OG462_43055 [Streptomyces sp. NBC_01077]